MAGNGVVLEPFFGDFMELIVDHRTLISSDVNLLPSLLTSVLGSSTHSLLTPQNIGKRSCLPMCSFNYFFVQIISFLIACLYFSSIHQLCTFIKLEMQASSVVPFFFFFLRMVTYIK